MINCYYTDDPKASHHWSFVYFHNLLEDHVCRSYETAHMPDLIGADEPMPTREGVYKVVVYGKTCLMFLWEGMGHITGLVVDPDDVDGCRYAENLKVVITKVERKKNGKR